MKSEQLIMELRQIYFSYEDGTEALKDINLQIYKGEKLAVLGSNGSGKSTLFLCLNGVNRPKSGKLLFKGEAAGYGKQDLLKLRRGVGIVFQEPDNQLFCADIIGELSFGLFNIGFSKEEAEDRTQNIIEEFGLKPFLYKPTHFLSAGQKKMVSIAEIVAMEPDIIIFDEPFAALDPKHSKMVEEMIDSLSGKGITVIQSSHDVDYAYRWADRILLMDGGTGLIFEEPCQLFKEQALLERVNLKQPAVMKVYGELVNKNIVEDTEQEPKSIEELIEVIQKLEDR